MKLTKDQRFTAYCIMLEEAETVLRVTEAGEKKRSRFGGSIGGLCDIIQEVAEDQYNSNGLENYGLIELIVKKPCGKDFYWFYNDVPGWQKRIKLLKQCIIETHP